MIKFKLKHLNSWVMPLILVSLGLHGLVLALPMPDLAQPPEPEPDLPDPEVIQVVSLPKLATGAEESIEPPLPEPEPPPPEPQAIFEEELVITKPEVLDEIEPELEASDDSSLGDEAKTEDTDEQTEQLPPGQSEGSKDYGTYDGSQLNSYKDPLAFLQKLRDWSGQIAETFPIPDSDKNSLAQMKGLEKNLLPFRPESCVNEPLSDEVAVGVVLDDDYSLKSTPEALSGTGYDGVTDELIEFAQLIEFVPDSDDFVGLKPHWLMIKVEYELCE